MNFVILFFLGGLILQTTKWLVSRLWEAAERFTLRDRQGIQTRKRTIRLSPEQKPHKHNEVFMQVNYDKTA